MFYAINEIGAVANMIHPLLSTNEIKKFVETYYPETEIISVNPVGLKGIFKDLYQEKE